jgi:hypothetical protein
MLTKKYLSHRVLAQAGAGCSYFWQGLMFVNNIFQQHCERITKNGKKTLFWTDSWVNDSPLASQFPRLFHITFQKGITLFKVKDEGWGSIRFRRTLYGETCWRVVDVRKCS